MNGISQKKMSMAKSFSPDLEAENTYNKSRQVSSGHSRLIEELDPLTDKVFQATGTHDGTDRIYLNSRLEGILRRGPRPVLNQGADYMETFESVLGPMPIARIFRERTKRHSCLFV